MRTSFRLSFSAAATAIGVPGSKFLGLGRECPRCRSSANVRGGGRNGTLLEPKRHQAGRLRTIFRSGGLGLMTSNHRPTQRDVLLLADPGEQAGDATPGTRRRTQGGRFLGAARS